MTHVPEGWRKTTIESHVNVITGYAFKSSEYAESDGSVRLLRGDNVKQGYLNWSEPKYWPEEKIDKKIAKYHLEAGDFIIALDRTWIPAGLKICEVTEEDLPCLLVQRVARLRARHTLAQPLLKQYFSTNAFVQFVKSVQTETAVPHISPVDVRDYCILLPPPLEQKKIAEILGTWDAAIAAQEKLIANSETQKKALMQQLLTGKKRLHGFSGAWEEVKLGDIVSITTASSKTEHINGSGTNFIIDMGSVSREGKLIPSKCTSCQEDMLQRGQIIMPKDDIGGGNIIGRAGYIPENERYVLSDHVYCLTAHGGDALFLSYLINSYPINKSLRRKANGTAQLGLGKKDVIKQLLNLPPLPEQTAIAGILSDADREIALQREKLGQLKQEKAALMQQLLTGKRRVTTDKQEKAA